MTDLICPYCWESSTAKQLRRFCPEQCGPDRTFFAATARTCPHGRPCPGARFCPHCTKLLEYDYITTKSRIIAMIGSRESGKSTYVGVLIHELSNRIGAAFDGMSTELVGDKSRTRYREVFAGPMYDEGVTLDVTNSVRAMHKLEPLLFMLRRPCRGVFGKRLDAAMMIFYDTAGEDVLNDEKIDLLVDYLAAADGILFMVDPLQISSVRREIDDGVPVPDQQYDQVAILTRLAALLRQRRGSTAGKLLDTPIAVAVAKTDALGAALPLHSTVRRASAHEGAYDDGDGRFVSDEVIATLSGWSDGEALVRAVANNFTHHRFFGVSALGITPPEKGVISPTGIHPLRVEDPMLWLLGRFGLVPVRKAKR